MDIRAHFYTPFGVVRWVRFCTAPKPPLCKGRCPAGAEGLSIPQSASLTAPFTQWSLSETDTQHKTRPMIVTIGRVNCFTNNLKTGRLFFYLVRKG